MPLLKVTDASGRQAQHQLNPQQLCLIGRAPDNQIVLDDPRASRHHAHIKLGDDGAFMIVDGVLAGGELRRSANKVYVNGEQKFEHKLKDGDRITIGASSLRFELPKEERTADLSFDDKPLGHTQVLMSARDVLSTVLRQAEPAGVSRDKVLETLQRKANILNELYEMSKTLGAGFDLDKIFKKATDIIFRSTPADRVVALLAEGVVTEQNADDAKLFAIATSARDEKLEAHARKMTIGRTITRKVMKEKVALLSQDAAADEQFAGVDSISEAEPLVGCELQVPLSERPAVESGAAYVSDLVGCMIFDCGREIGIVKDVRFGAGEAPLLVVGAGKTEHEIPYAQEFLVRVDLEHRRIETNLPEGLLDVNTPLTDEEKREQSKKSF